jgi:hypothetical protein
VFDRFTIPATGVILPFSEAFLKIENGAACRIRTGDSQFTKLVLYQLS